MGAVEAGEAPASPAHAHLCAEPGCHALRWTNVRRKQQRVVSAYCFEHSHVPMFDVPAEPVKSKWGMNAREAFRYAVARRRREREQGT